MDTKKTPDLNLAVNSAKKCCHGNKAVDTDHYLCLVRELIRLMEIFHRGLSTHLVDVGRAVKALEIRRVSGARCYYGDLALMVQYEKQMDLVRGTPELMSGSVALYDLTQSLGFMLSFLEALLVHTRTGQSFRAGDRIKVFTNTIGRQMPVVAQGSAKIALTKCPGRGGLMKRLASCCHGDVSPEGILSQLLEAVSPVHNTIKQVLGNTFE